MSDTTRIMDLPENVTMQINSADDRNDPTNTSYKPMDMHPNPYGHPPPSVPNIPTPSSVPKQQQYLPSRDIPMDPSQIIQDPEIQPNYIPPVPENIRQTNEYMKRYDEVTERKVSNHLREKEKKSKMDMLYEEGQIPVLVAVLFFIFHMPIVTNLMYKNLVFLKLFDTDGHFNTYGLIWQSIIFGASVYFIIKAVNTISEF